MKRILRVIALAAAVSGCAAVDGPRADASGPRLASDQRAADCDRMARRATGSAADTTVTFGGPSEAREWAAGSSKAAIDRELRWKLYRDCLDPNLTPSATRWQCGCRLRPRWLRATSG